jgi:hypothetical protein
VRYHGACLPACLALPDYCMSILIPSSIPKVKLLKHGMWTPLHISMVNTQLPTILIDIKQLIK